MARTDRRGPSRATFAAGVGILATAGAILLLDVVSHTLDEGVWLWAIALALVPVGPIVAAYLWLDRYEPEPRSLLALGFVWGALVATSAALVLEVLGRAAFERMDTMSAVIAAPVTEEAAKGAFLVLLIWARRHEVDGVLDGLVYAGFVGLGFAFTENVLFFGAALTGAGSLGPAGAHAAAGLFVLRGVMSPFAHPLFTSAIGVGIGLAVTRRRRVFALAPVVGYVVAVGLHAAWNVASYYAGGSWFLPLYVVVMLPAFAMAVLLAVWVRRSEGSMLTRALLECAASGLILPQEVPWVARLAARRAARAHAYAVAGDEGRRATASFQHQAVELAFLQDRVRRGVAPADSEERGSLIVRRMNGLRPYARFPTSPAQAQPRAGAATETNRRSGT